MAAANSSLSPKQRKAIAGLLSCDTIAQAAERAGVHERTVYRWMAEEPVFVAGLRQAQDRAIDDAVSRLSGDARNAANTLVEIHADPDVPPAVRVQAAGRLLSIILQLKENRDLAERVAALEEQLLKAKVT